MTFNPSTIRPRPRTRPQDAEPLADAIPLANAMPVADSMLAPRVLIRVPHLQLETQTAGPLFAAPGSGPQQTAATGAAVTEEAATLEAVTETAVADLPTAVVGIAIDEAPATTPFPKGILKFSLAEEESDSSGLGLAGLWSRVTAVVPAKYVTIMAGGLVVILLVIGLSHRRHRHAAPGGNSEAPGWNGAVSLPNSAPQPSAGTTNPITVAAQPKAPQAPLMSQPVTSSTVVAHSAPVFSGPSPSDILFSAEAARHATSSSPETAAAEPRKPETPAFGLATQQAAVYGPPRADSVPTMARRGPAWGGLPPRDSSISAQAANQPPMQAGPPEGYRTAQRDDPAMIPATRGPGEYGEPGVARFQGTIDRPPGQ